MRHDRGPRRDFARFAPVKVGDELNVKIEAVGEKGDGIAKKDGFVLFVPGAKQGDEVKIRVTRVLQKVGFAEVVGDKSESSSDSEKSQEEPYESDSGQSESSESAEQDYDQGTEDSENFGEDN